MGVTKTEVYSDEINRRARVFRALGHPARLTILRFLMEERCCLCGELAREIGLAQPTVSRHLRVLREAGLLRATVDANSLPHCVDASGLERVRDIVAHMLGK